jgi:hypothetical protein
MEGYGNKITNQLFLEDWADNTSTKMHLYTVTGKPVPN